MVIPFRTSSDALLAATAHTARDSDRFGSRRAEAPLLIWCRGWQAPPLALQTLSAAFFQMTSGRSGRPASDGTVWTRGQRAQVVRRARHPQQSVIARAGIAELTA